MNFSALFVFLLYQLPQLHNRFMDSANLIYQTFSDCFFSDQNGSYIF